MITDIRFFFVSGINQGFAQLRSKVEKQTRDCSKWILFLCRPLCKLLLGPSCCYYDNAYATFCTWLRIRSNRISSNLFQIITLILEFCYFPSACTLQRLPWTDQVSPFFQPVLDDSFDRRSTISDKKRRRPGGRFLQSSVILTWHSLT